MTEKRHTMFDDLPPRLQKQWRENSAKGGRMLRGEVKARASRIGWKNSPNRNVGRPPAKPSPTAAIPEGFFCSGCGKWHAFPLDMPKTLLHTCACGVEHRIRKGIATPRNGKAKA